MNIFMAGIDSGSAALRQREAFAFTKTQAVQAMHAAAKLPGVEGCVIIFTCNRTELWLYAEEDGRADPAELLCSLKGQAEEPFRDIITVRQGWEAVRHLFETACGLHSLIWGEDQIVTQIRSAADLALAEGTTGKVLGKLFQEAVACAKKIKTQVRFAAGNSSVAAAAIESCGELCGSVKGLRLLVVGSGEMGRLTAQAFAEAGAEVTMTLRQYRYGISVIPDNCGSLPYDGRYAGVKDADIIVSATSSPHHTLGLEPVREACAANPKRRIFLDLAVPRDVDSRIAELPDCRLLTIDDIPCRVRAEEKAAVEAQCRKIIGHYIREFEKQLIAWSTLPAVHSLAHEFQDSLCEGLEKELQQSAVSPEEMKIALNAARRISEEKACKMLFAFRDWMEKDAGAQEMLSRDEARIVE